MEIVTGVAEVRVSNQRRLQISHTTDPGIQYAIQSSTDMVAGSWKKIGTTVIGDGAISASHFPFDAVRKFYRVVREDPNE